MQVRARCCGGGRVGPPAAAALPDCPGFRSRHPVFARRVFREQNQHRPRNSWPLFVFAAGVLMMVTTSCRIVFHLLPIGGDSYLAAAGAQGRRQVPGRAPLARVPPAAVQTMGAGRRGGSPGRTDDTPGRLFAEPQTSVLCQPTANY